MECSDCGKEIRNGDGHYKLGDEVFCIECWQKRKRLEERRRVVEGTHEN